MTHASKDPIHMMADRIREGSGGETIVNLAAAIAKRDGIGDGFDKAERLLRDGTSDHLSASVIALADQVQANTGGDRERAIALAAKQVTATPPSIVTLANRIEAEQGCGCEVAFVRAEKLLASS